AGFDGRNAWFDVDVNVNYINGGHWTLRLAAVRESDYATFLADSGNPYRVCDDEGCYIGLTSGPEDRYVPKLDWPWWTAMLETESGAKALPITKSGRYSTLLPFEGPVQPLTFETSWTCPVCGEVLSLVVPYGGGGWTTLVGMSSGSLSWLVYEFTKSINVHMGKDYELGRVSLTEAKRIQDEARNHIYTEHSAFVVQVQNLPLGNYVVLLSGTYMKNSWGCGSTLWEIGRISY
ncbi:unnamed protein product, partial [marine sediment metagenome]